MMNRSDEELVNEAKATFDQSVDKLDAATLSTLNRGRQRALEAPHSRRARWPRWVPVAGMATATLLVALLVLPGPVELETNLPTVDDMEILLGEESIEMLEDLEFYALIELLEEDDDVG
jgi:hypothetical protein